MPDVELNTQYPSLQAAPMLFWRIDLLKRSFSNLNDFAVGGLEKDNYRFFKDSSYRDSLVLPQDHAIVSGAVAAIKQRLPVSIVFRVQPEQGSHWFKLTGWPVGGHRYYEGMVEEISAHVDQLQAVFADRGGRLHAVEQDAYPVAIFNRKDKGLVRFNPPFAKLFNVTPGAKKKFRLDSLLTAEVKLPLFEERLLLERRLSDTFFVNLPDGRQIQVLGLMEGFVHQGIELIRFSVLNSPVVPEGLKNATFSLPEVETLCSRLQECGSIVEMLDAVFSRRDLLPGLDAVMYSDIYAKKNSVYVYARGSLFEALEPGSQYPYSGTIAENIEKENLEYLIVDDTHASIKAIDWALFVPHGVRSYIAKALYVRGAMRTVLIFCSGQKQAFGDDRAGTATRIAEAFHQRLKQLKSR